MEITIYSVSISVSNILEKLLILAQGAMSNARYKWVQGIRDLCPGLLRTRFKMFGPSRYVPMGLMSRLC